MNASADKEFISPYLLREIEAPVYPGKEERVERPKTYRDSKGGPLVPSATEAYLSAASRYVQQFEIERMIIAEENRRQRGLSREEIDSSSR